MKKQKCIKCDYQWKSRVQTPRQCPRCKRYDWYQAIALFIKHAEPKKAIESH